MSSYLTKVNGFTPVIDAIVTDVGLIPAVVFGNIWRYCQMADRVCREPLDTIAARIGISRKTVERHVKALCEHGYLQDLTPDLKHKPHTYANTGKAIGNNDMSSNVLSILRQKLLASGWSKEGAMFICDLAKHPRLRKHLKRFIGHSQEWTQKQKRKTKKQAIPAAIRKIVFERDAYRCQHCSDWHDLTVDHIIPECAGGDLDPRNLQTLCRKCNSKKGTKVPQMTKSRKEEKQ